MLYAHGSDLCHDSELRHAMANCLEALLGAVFLDGGIVVSSFERSKIILIYKAEIMEAVLSPARIAGWSLQHGSLQLQQN